MHARSANATCETLICCWRVREPLIDLSWSVPIRKCGRRRSPARLLALIEKFPSASFGVPIFRHFDTLGENCTGHVVLDALRAPRRHCKRNLRAISATLNHAAQRDSSRRPHGHRRARRFDRSHSRRHRAHRIHVGAVAWSSRIASRSPPHDRHRTSRHSADAARRTFSLSLHASRRPASTRPAIDALESRRRRGPRRSVRRTRRCLQIRSIAANRGAARASGVSCVRDRSRRLRHSPDERNGLNAVDRENAGPAPSIPGGTSVRPRVRRRHGIRRRFRRT